MKAFLVFVDVETGKKGDDERPRQGNNQPAGHMWHRHRVAARSPASILMDGRFPLGIQTGTRKVMLTPFPPDRQCIIEEKK